MSSAIRLVSVGPDVLGTYGDSGNVVVLERRLAWRGLDVEVVVAPLGAPVPREGDLYVMGGAEDQQQLVALEWLRDKGFPEAVAAGGHVLTVCAGLQILGETMTDERGRTTPGLGLLDITTSRLHPRVVGEVLADPVPEVPVPPLTGFANHGGSTHLGADARPLATTLHGRGNDGVEGGPEGVLQGTIVATYLHGPVLARNPAFADWLVERATGTTLPPLPDDPSVALHGARVAAHHGAGVTRRRWRRS